ncbi:hypothetical protein CFOL_v3_02552 [Cephalotus follicularis]|uniref:Uncharacterized protein n=1 Tax=Cephalotus follicularis TaxID=3775 RepID=A0A1Q3ATI5_CEPFO|nr:hypothetical protein CFOL_v3_02552 [Cephalotus follicularis]
MTKISLLYTNYFVLKPISSDISIKHTQQKLYLFLFANIISATAKLGFIPNATIVIAKTTRLRFIPIANKTSIDTDRLASLQRRQRPTNPRNRYLLRFQEYLGGYRQFVI